MDARQMQFEALVQAYSADLYRYALWLVRDPSQAEDLVQECFMRAWRAIGSLRDPAAAKSWLFTILRRERARRYAQRRLESQALDDVDVEAVAGATDARTNPDVLVVRKALAALSDDYREPLLLQVLGGFTCEEIGGMLGLKPGAVMTRLSRARQKLRGVLEDDDQTPAEGEVRL